MHTDPPPLNIGVIGLGRAFTLMLPTFLMDSRVRLCAAFDPLPAALQQFSVDFPIGKAYGDLQGLLGDQSVELIYVASPHQFHAEHVCAALNAGKHVLVEKPMALSIDECRTMIVAAQHAQRHLIVGHSHSFNRPVLHARQLIQSGRWGQVRMVHAFNYTDFLYRPRRPEELQTESGGGVVFSQAAHQIDIVRALVGHDVATVQALTGNWDTTRPTEGAYSALLRFDNAAFASLTYSGYAHFDSDELLNDIGEMGQMKRREDYGAARRRLQQNALAETELKTSRNYGGANYAPPAQRAPDHYQHFGHIVVSCDRADFRLLPDALVIYGDSEQSFSPLPAPQWPRKEVIDELWRITRLGEQPLHDGAWGMATLQFCIALLESARSGQTVALC